MAFADTDRKASEGTTPFEWLTSPASLHPHILSALRPADEKNRVLHVGCGSSVLGELLICNPVYRVEKVVNVDNDDVTLRLMQERWQQRRQEQQDELHAGDSSSTSSIENEAQMIFENVDFTCERGLKWEDASFHLVLDKSTLDCLLCTDKAAAGLLTEVYRVLKPGGVYLLVSFHHEDFLQPLLSNLPGADWKVSRCVMQREVEDLISSSSKGENKSPSSFQSEASSQTQPELLTITSKAEEESSNTTATTASSEYRRTLNVFQCRKRTSASTVHHHDDGTLDWDAVYHHVHDTNDQWFRKENPMLSQKRKLEIHATFGGKPLDLATAYQVIFTDAEREHLEYEGFLDDWKAFQATRSDLDADRVSSDVVIAFLGEMQ